MKKPELEIQCCYGYYDENQLFAYVCNDPYLWVSGYDGVAKIKNKLKAKIRKMKLPYKLKFKWTLR